MLSLNPVPTNSMEMRLSFCATRSSMPDHGTLPERTNSSAINLAGPSVVLSSCQDSEKEALPFTTVGIEPSSLEPINRQSNPTTYRQNPQLFQTHPCERALQTRPLLEFGNKSRIALIITT